MNFAARGAQVQAARAEAQDNRVIAREGTGPGELYYIWSINRAACISMCEFAWRMLSGLDYSRLPRRRRSVENQRLFSDSSIGNEITGDFCWKRSDSYLQERIRKDTIKLNDKCLKKVQAVVRSLRTSLDTAARTDILALKLARSVLYRNEVFDDFSAGNEDSSMIFPSEMKQERFFF